MTNELNPLLEGTSMKDMTNQPVKYTKAGAVIIPEGYFRLHTELAKPGDLVAFTSPALNPNRPDTWYRITKTPVNQAQDLIYIRPKKTSKPFDLGLVGKEIEMIVQLSDPVEEKIHIGFVKKVGHAYCEEDPRLPGIWITVELEGEKTEWLVRLDDIKVFD